jgi:hypothetical protein
VEAIEAFYTLTGRGLSRPGLLALLFLLLGAAVTYLHPPNRIA